MVRARSDGADGADDSDPSGHGGLCERPGTRFDHAENRHRTFFLEHVEGSGRRSVTGDDYHLDVVGVDEVASDLAGEAAHFGEVAWPIWVAAGVTEVHEVFGGKKIHYGARHGQATEAGVEHPDGPRVHGSEIRSTGSCGRVL